MLLTPLRGSMSTKRKYQTRIKLSARDIDIDRRHTRSLILRNQRRGIVGKIENKRRIGKVKNESIRAAKYSMVI